MSSETIVQSNEELDGSSLKDNSRFQNEEEVPVEVSTENSNRLEEIASK